MAMHNFVRNTDKQLKMLKLDEMMLKHKLQRLENPGTIANLIVEVSSKEEKVKRLERKNKKLKGKFRGTTKSLSEDNSPEKVKLT